MIRAITYVAVVALLGISAGPAAAVAASPNAVDQYTEQVPTPGGDRPPKDESPDTGDAPSEGTQDSSGGDDSQIGSPSAGGSGPGGGNQGKPTGSDVGTGGPQALPREDSGSLPGSVFSGVTDDSSGEGMGPLFPIVLIVILLAAGVLIVRARRERQNPAAR